MAYTYALGPVKPHVRIAANSIGRAYGVKTIYGFASRPGNSTSDHPKGLALDFMVYGDSAKGDAIASYVQANARKLNVTYVIWKQRIWSVGDSGWEPMEDRGSITANHYDHVHVSFAPSNSSGVTSGDIQPAANLTSGIPNPLETGKAALGVAAWAVDPHNWLRVAMIVGGIVLLLFTVIRMGIEPKAVAQVARKVVK